MFSEQALFILNERSLTVQGTPHSLSEFSEAQERKRMIPTEYRELQKNNKKHLTNRFIWSRLQKLSKNSSTSKFYTKKCRKKIKKVLDKQKALCYTD